MRVLHQQTIHFEAIDQTHTLSSFGNCSSEDKTVENCSCCCCCCHSPCHCSHSSCWTLTNQSVAPASLANDSPLYSSVMGFCLAACLTAFLFSPVSSYLLICVFVNNKFFKRQASQLFLIYCTRSLSVVYNSMKDTMKMEKMRRAYVHSSTSSQNKTSLQTESRVFFVLKVKVKFSLSLAICLQARDICVGGIPRFSGVVRVVGKEEKTFVEKSLRLLEFSELC